MNIGIFDSGLGGLSILRNIIKLLPEYNYVYLGDNKNVPYGEKSAGLIYDLTCQSINYLAKEKNCHLIILACNTASTVLRRIQQEFLPTYATPLKVLGVIRPAAEAILESSQQPVGVLATEATVRSSSFIYELEKLGQKRPLPQQACPALVPLIEEGHVSDEEIRRVVRDYTAELKQKGVKSLLLGCTHYELISDSIQEISGLSIITEGTITAKKLANYLQRHPEIEKKLSRQGKREYCFTHVDQQYEKLTALFMKHFDQIQTVQQVKLTD